MSSIRNIILDLIIVTVIFVILLLVYKELNKDTAVIEPFQVPLDLEKQNITGQAVVSKLLDQIEIIKEKADTSYKNLDFKPVFSDSQLEIVIPGSGISLKSLLQNVKNFLGKKQTRISGEILLNSGKLFLTVRVLGEPAKTFSGELSELDKLLEEAAHYILIYTNPYLLAYYLYYNYSDNRNEALEMIQYTLSHEPADDDVMAYTLDGCIKSDEKKYEESILLYKKAIETDPGYIDAYNGWAYSLFKMKKYSEADSVYSLAIKINPKNPNSYYYRAILLDNAGKNDASEENFKIAVNLNPDNAELLTDYGKFLMKINKTEESMSLFEKVIERYPKFSEAYFLKGNLLFTQKKYDEALKLYRKAVELKQDYTDAYLAAGKIYAEQSKTEEADTMYRNAVKYDSSSSVALLELGKFLANRKKFPEAAVMLDRSLKIDSSVNDAYVSLGNILEEQNKKNEAAELYRKALRQKETDTVYFRNKISELTSGLK